MNSEIFRKISSAQSLFLPWLNEWILITDDSWIEVKLGTRTEILILGSQALESDTY